ncbi:unnamed protein product, partial [Adineta ricciae]
NDLLNVEITDTLQTQQEEQALLEHLSSSTSADERQLHQHRQEEAKEEYQQRKEEQQKHKQSLANSLSIHNQNVELSNIPEEKNSFSSLYALSDPIVEHNDNDNQSHLFTST